MKTSIQFSILLMLSLIWFAQLAFIPVILSAIFCFMIISLAWFYKKNRHDPSHDFSKTLKGIMVVAALFVIFSSYKSFIGVEAGTSVLAVFLYAKALETKTKRDLIILFNFALFVTASLFLHSQSMWMALIVIACLVSGLVGLYRIQTSEFQKQHHPIQSLKTDAGHILKFIGLAVPFFLLLFIFFPRFPPLWQIPIKTDKSVTGISDRMSPGEIAELSQSSKLAFRVIGDMQKFPSRNELYWRAMALDQYDGKTWISSFLNLQVKQSIQDFDKQSAVRYEYLPADETQKWVTALEKSVPLERRFNLHQDYAITPDYLIKANKPIPLLWLGKNFENQNLTLNTAQQNVALQYPKGSDLEAQKFARELFQQSRSNPELYIENLIRWYQNKGFAYTLQPGVLGENRVDEFLFKTRQGFCEHYASSFVLLLRYVGIPARVVVGYQGGQLAPDQKSWEVRQLDAHAWTEVFIHGSWQRIDPTAIIAPQRIYLGMQDYISNDQSIFGSQENSSWQYQQFALLKNLRVWSDYVSFQWQNKVIGYDTEKQNKWMSWLGLNSIYSNAIALFVGIALLGGIYYLVSRIRSESRKTHEMLSIEKFSKKLKAPQQKIDNETFQQWMVRLSNESGEVQPFEAVILQFQKIVYLNQKDDLTFKKFDHLLKECSSVLERKEKNLS